MQNLSPTELFNLKRYAELRLRALGQTRGGGEWRDVLHDAALTIASGSRRWPEHINLYAMLRGTIRSLTDARTAQFIAGRSAPLDFAAESSDPDPERTVSAKEQVEQLYRMFALDERAIQVLDAWAVGLVGAEIRDCLGISETELNTIAKRIARRLERESSQ